MFPVDEVGGKLTNDYGVVHNRLRQSGIEPEAKPWKGFMLPLHH